MCYTLVKLVGLEEDRDEVIKLIQSIKHTQMNLSEIAKCYVETQLNELYLLLRNIEMEIKTIETMGGINHQPWWKCIF